MEKDFATGLTFDDVLLEPRESRVEPSQANLETKLTKKITLQIPIISAAMDTVSGPKMALEIARLGGMAVLHRNNTVKEQHAMLKKVKAKKALVGAAVGPFDIDRAIALDKEGVDVLVVDCAHAHNINVVESAKKIKKKVKAQLIVGNIATAEAAKELVKFVDGIKVGVGPGAICTTRVVAGIGVPQLSAILNVTRVVKGRVPVIADGGMKYSGDIVKALGAGASSVMLGSMLAGTDESPGKVLTIKGVKYKSYRGMGSLEAMKTGNSSDRYFQKGAKKYVAEGVSAMTPYKGKLEDVIYQITGGIKSGMGYIGAKAIKDIIKQAKFIRITNAGLLESHPHSVTTN